LAIPYSLYKKLGGETKRKMNKQTLGKFNQNASLKKGIVVCLLAAALLVSMVGMASAESQTWHLSSDDITGGKVMYQGEHQVGGTANVSIGAGNSVIWIANQSALVDVSFTTDTGWGEQLKKTDATSQYYTVEIGIWNGTAFISKGSSYEQFVSTDWDAFAISAMFTVPAGDYLALNVTPDTDMSIMTELFLPTSPGVSRVSSPSTDPGYPYPELPTIILMSAGLLALFSYVVYGRRRNNK
jgi:hypothetical protein